MATAAVQTAALATRSVSLQVPPKPPSIAEDVKNTLTFDSAEIARRYKEEREKRLRPDGIGQYQQFTGAFAPYLQDPYMPRIEREPLNIETDFMVLGGGFGGLLLAARLIESGVTDIRVVDKSGDFGGTWYWNRYPGAACDIESYVYMPLLEETGYIPQEKYAKAPELLEHSRRIGRHYGLYSKAIFHTEVRHMEWDDTSSRWVISTNRGDVIRARFAASASGPLNMPKLPGVPGIEKFRGHSFHTSRWDYSYTGGGQTGELSNLHDKRVGFIGTGATAVQAIPQLAASAKQLFVFQRTPSSVSRRDNRPTDKGWAAALKPGWQQNRMDNFLRVMAGAGDEPDLVADGWTAFGAWMRERGLSREQVFHRAGGPSVEAWREWAMVFDLSDMQNMENIRNRCESEVRDRETAEKLKPWYRLFCKRPCFHDEYLQAFNRPNVTLVDTDGQGVERITERGIVANGKEYELDCIVYGTGFEVGTTYARRSNFDITGREGQTLSQKWNDGAFSLHGLHVNGFPNLFIISTIQSGYAANFVHMLSAQAKHVAWITKQCKERGVGRLEATKEAEEQWTDVIVNGGRINASYLSECTPGYYNLEGQITESMRSKRFASYAAGPLAFVKVLDEWREKGDLEGLAMQVVEEAWNS